jgi:hypothetical protein
MGETLVPEFMSPDGVIDAPVRTADFGFDDRMGEAVATPTARCQGILLGRTTYQMVFPDGVEGRFGLVTVEQYSNRGSSTWRRRPGLIAPVQPPPAETVNETVGTLRSVGP